MDGNTNPWWEWSGLTPPEDEGGREQEVADPAEPTAEAEGGREQEVADPVEAPAETETAEEAEGSDTAGEDPVTEGSAPKGEESKGGRDSYEAAKRRERERTERERLIRDEEATKAAEKLKTILGSLGLRDASGKPVETAEDFERYEAEQRSAKLQRELKAGKLTQEGIRAALLSSPEVQGILKQAENVTNAAKQKEQEARASKFQADMERELTEIRKLNPQIRTTDDIIRMETGPEYARYIRTGLTPSQAYKMANFDAIRRADKLAAEQAARNAAAGKGHLRSTPSGGNALSAPADYVANMRKYVPGITDKEIERIYKESAKKK